MSGGDVPDTVADTREYFGGLALVGAVFPYGISGGDLLSVLECYDE